MASARMALAIREVSFLAMRLRSVSRREGNAAFYGAGAPPQWLSRKSGASRRMPSRSRCLLAGNTISRFRPVPESIRPRARFLGQMNEQRLVAEIGLLRLAHAAHAARVGQRECAFAGRGADDLAHVG